MTGSSNLVPSSPSGTALPHVLVADDDPASCRFLCDGLNSLGASTEACLDGHDALQLARARAFDLLLLDCRMPGVGALQILTALRSDTQALSNGSPAVATTAELAPSARQALLDAGFGDILLKPCTVAELRHVLAQVQDVRTLDDDAALAASGDASTMQALRLLLRTELASLEQELETLGRDRTALNDRLHRLRSSCGFCGASALSEQTIALQSQLSRHDAMPAALARFRKTLQATLAALEDQSLPRDAR